VEDSLVLRGEVVEAIRRWKPEIIFTHDPEHPDPPYLFHRDHRVVGRVVLDAVYPAARDPLNFPEHFTRGLTPHAVGAVWLFASSVADAFVDIRAGFDRKIAARLAHESQTADPDELRSNWRKQAFRIGEPIGLACAEAFTILRLS